MTISRMADIVCDWGGFEALVAELHVTGDVTVERNIVLTGRSGAQRQIDVLVKYTQGFYEHILIVECKYLSRPVGRREVDALALAVQDLGAARGVIFSRAGFQKGAIRQAKHENISLYRVRDAEIKFSGDRYLTLVLHFVSYSLLNVISIGRCGQEDLVKPWVITHNPGIRGVHDDLQLGGVSGITAREFEVMMRDAVSSLHERRMDEIDQGFVGPIRYVDNISIKPSQSIVSEDVYPGMVTDTMSVDVGVSIHQDILNIDRMSNLAFVFALEDCVKSEIRAVSGNPKELKFVKIDEPNESTIISEQSRIINVVISSGWGDPHAFADVSGREFVYGEVHRGGIIAADSPD